MRSSAEQAGFPSGRVAKGDDSSWRVTKKSPGIKAPPHHMGCEGALGSHPSKTDRVYFTAAACLYALPFD